MPAPAGKTPGRRGKPPAGRQTLFEDDVLFFLHIPKAGGLSLISILDQRFSPEAICDLHSAREPGLFLRFPRRSFRRIRFVRGHFLFGPFDGGIYRYIAPNPIIAAVLREPVSRLVSAYRYICRTPANRRYASVVGGGLSLQDYVRDARFVDETSNVQTRMILGAFPRPAAGLGDEAMGFLAKERLEQFAFVGIAERFEETVALLMGTFGWPEVRMIPRLNADPDPQPRDIPDDVRGEILQRNRLDVLLYEHGRRLFEDRLRARAAGRLSLGERAAS
jgi:hypothetical protein